MKYELSRKLTKSEQASLDSARAGLSKALDGIALALKNPQRLKKLADLLSRESALEVEADRGSEDASLKLAGVKDQVTRLRRALANPPGGGAGGALNHEVLQASGLLQTVVVGDVQRQIEDLIEARNGDFFFDRTTRAAWPLAAMPYKFCGTRSRPPRKPWFPGGFPKVSDFSEPSTRFWPAALSGNFHPRRKRAADMPKALLSRAPLGGGCYHGGGPSKHQRGRQGARRFSPGRPQACPARALVGWPPRDGRGPPRRSNRGSRGRRRRGRPHSPPRMLTPLGRT